MQEICKMVVLTGVTEEYAKDREDLHNPPPARSCDPLQCSLQRWSKLTIPGVTVGDERLKARRSVSDPGACGPRLRWGRETTDEPAHDAGRRIHQPCEDQAELREGAPEREFRPGRAWDND